jgi:arylsulfatase A-like enzyme
MAETRRDFLKTAGLSASMAVAALRTARASAAPRRPNVILVMTDDQGYGDLGCHGHPHLKTPNLNALHEDSIRFTQFHVSPTCAPTRAALMTGRDNNRTGVWHTIMGRSILRRDEVTMADVFAGNGYHTGVFGKWHLGDSYPYRVQDRGFQQSVMHLGGGVGQGPDYWGNDYFDDTYRRNGELEQFKGYCTDIWFDEALNFIDDNRKHPFFCYIPTNAAHSPFNVDEKYSKPYADIAAPQVANFWGMIDNIDDNMGRLMHKLDDWGLRENTILIFMTDNGSTFNEHAQGYSAGMKSSKASQYEGGHRVPFFMHWPGGGVDGGRDIDRLAVHFDVLPTLIDLCDLKAPDKVQFDGVSLNPLLNGGDFPERTVVINSQRVDHPIKWRNSSVMTDQWRLIDGERLYDIQKDSHQDHNLAEQHPRVVEKLRKDYEVWWASVSERFDEYCELVIGAPEENPTCLMSHDVHGTVAWSQREVRQAKKVDGFWAVDVARKGNYEFRLRRWPEEADLPITADAGKDTVAIKPTEARINVAGVDQVKTIPEGANEVVFRIPLKAGSTRLQAWFVDGHGDGKVWGAYYVYAERV